MAGPQTFQSVYDEYTDDIQRQSRKTGRKIKTKTYTSGDKFRNIVTRLYWLDRGQLDDAACELNTARHRACDYPDGFEEYSISYELITSINDDSTIETLVIDKDNVATNSRQFVDMVINSAAGNCGVNVTATTEKYDAHHKYRNQYAADIRAGKYRPETTRRVSTDTARKWDSDLLFPDAAVSDFSFDYSAE